MVSFVDSAQLQDVWSAPQGERPPAAPLAASSDILAALESIKLHCALEWMKAVTSPKPVVNGHVGTNARCSFCGLATDEVSQIVAGPRAHICDACVDMCASIIAKGRKPGPRERPKVAMLPSACIAEDIKADGAD
jgi:hypothetical protein